MIFTIIALIKQKIRDHKFIKDPNARFYDYDYFAILEAKFKDLCCIATVAAGASIFFLVKTASDCIDAYSEVQQDQTAEKVLEKIEQNYVILDKEKILSHEDGKILFQAEDGRIIEASYNPDSLLNVSDNSSLNYNDVFEPEMTM